MKCSILMTLGREKLMAKYLLTLDKRGRFSGTANKNTTSATDSTLLSFPAPPTPSFPHENTKLNPSNLPWSQSPIRALVPGPWKINPRALIIIFPCAKAHTGTQHLQVELVFRVALKALPGNSLLPFRVSCVLVKQNCWLLTDSS